MVVEGFNVLDLWPGTPLVPAPAAGIMSSGAGYNAASVYEMQLRAGTMTINQARVSLGLSPFATAAADAICAADLPAAEGR